MTAKLYLDPAAPENRAFTAYPEDGWQEAPEDVQIEFRQELLWSRVKVARSRCRDGIIQTPWGPLQVDPDSRANIAGAAQGASIAKAAGEDRTFTWTMADNSEPEFTADDMISLGLLAMDHVDRCYGRGRDLRKQIFAPNVTLSDLDDVELTIETGWPA